MKIFGSSRRLTNWSSPRITGPSFVVVTMGCGDACPVLPGKRYVDWELTDPAGLPADEVRAVRDEIDRRVNGLVNDLGRAGEKVEADHSGA